MNEQTPETGKKPKKFGLDRVLVIIAAVIVGLSFLRGCPRTGGAHRSGEYQALDYDLVMRTPNLFSGEAAYLEGTLEQIVPTAPEVTSRDIYLLVAEKDDPDHLWFVFGPFEAENVARLQTGMDIVAYGVCEGAITLTNKAGFEHTYPQIAFVDLQYGYQIGPDRP